MPDRRNRFRRSKRAGFCKGLLFTRGPGSVLTPQIVQVPVEGNELTGRVLQFSRCVIPEDDDAGNAPQGITEARRCSARSPTPESSAAQIACRSAP
jgi:hypothetical protein